MPGQFPKMECQGHVWLSVKQEVCGFLVLFTGSCTWVNFCRKAYRVQDMPKMVMLGWMIFRAYPFDRSLKVWRSAASLDRALHSEEAGRVRCLRSQAHIHDSPSCGLIDHCPSPAWIPFSEPTPETHPPLAQLSWLPSYARHHHHHHHPLS